MKTTTAILILTLAASVAHGQPTAPGLDFPDSVPEGSSRQYQVCFRQPGRCTTQSLMCRYNTQCPIGEKCGAPTGVTCTGNGTDSPVKCNVTPSGAEIRIDAITVESTCAGGTKAGQGCSKDSQCPGSTCTSPTGVLLASTPMNPTTSCVTVTVPADSNKVVNAITVAPGLDEHQLITICWDWASGHECEDRRRAVKRQPFAG